ncbi:uncharacterized protein Tco025E_02364 [Trypanosoma conorhini]|uniref:Uncharacterized protein n=1 Tax=Trypanosoma conorhini TaxID=83891 RepID=A0A3R7M2G0_9TRYP|nr:uncharacterized protein Tco025E_02364 [Trypanosoma conorhini]RNF25340.1 hypothetical protein Tco025E_02364 [Trypanosoma conorhini]
MLFRDTASCAHSSEGSEDYPSSGGSLASSESCATRAFENRMKLIFDSGPVLDFEAQEGRDRLDDAGPRKEGTAQEKGGVACSFADGASDGRESVLNAEDEAYLGLLMQGIDKMVLLDTEFYQYPTPDYFKAHPPRRNLTDDQTSEGGISSSHHHGTKMFIGGLRFEVVHVGRHMIGWIFEVACGVRLPSSSILVHRKAKGGRSGAPTGCASVFVSSEEEVERLLAMNQRLFCAEKGVYVAPSAERMAELIASKAILDVTEGRARGPTHPVIIERAYGNAGHHGARSSASASMQQENVLSGPPPPYDAVLLGPRSGSTSLPSCSNASSLRSSLSVPLGPGSLTGGGDQPGRTRLLTPANEPIYHLYPGTAEVSKLLPATSAALQRAVSLFVGGFSAETDQEFVAWVFSLMSVPVHPSNVSHYVDSQSGERAGCVLVRVEEQDVSKALSWNKRVVCDARGVYFASSQRAVVALLAARDKAAGPARPLAIKRKDGARGVPKATVPGSMAPPPPFPVMWDSAQPSPATWQRTGSPPVAPPPPYMQSVIIGNQTYQLPPGASIQLQVVPVITAPNMSTAPVPLQSPALSMYQPMPPPPPPPLR